MIEIGDIIIYADGRKDRVVGMPTINGQHGLLVKPIRRKPLFMSDNLKLLAEVQEWAGLGVWTIKKGKQSCNTER